MHIKRRRAPIIAGLLLLMLLLPQLALANPAAISLSKASGYCGDQIEAAATVDSAGTYRICWASIGNVIQTFTAGGAGNHTVQFTVPETVKGTYAVYLTTGNTSLATSSFTLNSSVRINPTEGPVGTVVTFTGNGFGASQDIQVSFLGTASTAKANSVGSWTLNYTIPATPGSGYTFKVEFKEGTVWYPLEGSYYFEVTPKITAPGSGTVGQTIQVNGTGFGSKEAGIKVIFRRQGTTVDVVAKDSISAGEDGSWEATVVVPAVQGGTYAIDASGAVTAAGDVPDVSFTLGAGILVEPSSASVGDRITVAGGGFASGETGIRVTIDGQVVATLTARTNGTWESSFVLPPSTYGSHTVSASGDLTKNAATATLSTQAKIEAVSPLQGAPGDSVSLTGSGFSSGQRLTVTVGGVATSESLQSLSNGNVVVSFKVPKGSIKGGQTLVVTDGGGATASAAFTVIEKILATPQPVSPQQGSRLMSGQVTFRWGATTGGNNITYILQISDKPDPATYVHNIPDIQTSTYTLSKDEALLTGTYYWWVKAVDNYDNKSPWSDSSSFNVFVIPPWLWVIIGLVILIVLMVVAYRETKFKIAE